jgi:hypothetical protein
MSLESRRWPLGSRLLEDLKHAREVAAVGGYGRVVGAKGRFANRQRPLQLHPSTLQVPKLPQHAAKIAMPAGLNHKLRGHSRS